MTSTKSIRVVVKGHVSRLKDAVADKLRWRLGFYQRQMLPPLPAEGISTGRGARLRAYREADVAKYAALLDSAGAELAQFSSFGDQPEVWLKEARRNAELSRSPYELAIVVDGAEGEEFAGAFFLTLVNDRPGAIEVGFLLAPTALGMGIGPRLARAVIAWAAESGVHRVETRHDVVNTTACRAASGLGMIQEGVNIAAYPMEEDGEVVWHDVCEHAYVNPAHRRASLQ